MLLGSFKIDYISKGPYINCIPSLHHHRIGPNDKFLVLSCDGLYQYFPNKEVVDEVEMFTTMYPRAILQSISSENWYFGLQGRPVSNHLYTLHNTSLPAQTSVLKLFVTSYAY